MKKFAIAAASLFVLSGVAACGESATDKAAEKQADAIEATGEARADQAGSPGCDRSDRGPEGRPERPGRSGREERRPQGRPCRATGRQRRRRHDHVEHAVDPLNPFTDGPAPVVRDGGFFSFGGQSMHRVGPTLPSTTVAWQPKRSLVAWHTPAVAVSRRGARIALDPAIALALGAVGAALAGIGVADHALPGLHPPDLFHRAAARRAG